MKVLIMGASGAGQTTLGHALAEHMGYQFVDTDDYYWAPTTPPYQLKRVQEDRLRLILTAMKGKDVVVAGSIMGWGKALEQCFDLVVFLSLDTGIRLQRLRFREQRETGQVDESFIAWASEYENDKFSGRNRVKHEHWLTQQRVPIVRLSGDKSVTQRLDEVLAALAQITQKQV